jgi:glycerol-3-phosphate acyltransferase PlsY
MDIASMPYIGVLPWVFVGVAGYFLGNIHTGIIISRLIAKQDVRDQGSGNAGTTNMFRMLGMKASLLTLLGDMLKAILAGLIGLFVLGEYGALLGGAACVVGHNWPVLLGFRGGKGIAATAGTLLISEPIVFLIMFPLALLFIGIIKVVSIVSIVAVSLCVVLTFVTRWGDWPHIAYIVALWAMAIFSHRSNIKRLMDGTEFERKLDFSKGKKK